MFGLVSAAWRFRHFIASSVRSEFATRFARSRFGLLWMILNPLAQAAIVAFVLSSVLAAKLPGIESEYAYALYLMAGTLGWALFSETITRCLTVFTHNGNLLKKLVFPRICLPLVVAGICLVSNLMLGAATLLAFLVLGHWPGLQGLWLPALIVLTLGLALAIGLALGVLNVFLRDLEQVVPIALQFLYWLTPVVYLPAMIPPDYRPYLALNPLATLVDSYQRILVFGIAPDASAVAGVAVLAAAVAALALLLFRRASEHMVDVL